MNSYWRNVKAVVADVYAHRDKTRTKFTPIELALITMWNSYLHGKALSNRR